MQELGEWKNRHVGETIIVCGNGPSLNTLIDAVVASTTIGVNDACYYFEPDYLVIIDKVKTFIPERQEFILQAKDVCKAVFCNDPNELYGHFRGGKAEQVLLRPTVLDPRLSGVMSLRERDKVYTAITSTFTAVTLASVFGANRIGLAGVDLIAHEKLSPQLERLNDSYQLLAHACKQAGILLLNLSESSLLETVRKGTFSDLRSAPLP